MDTEERKEFWEWCGFKYEKIGQGHMPDFVEFYEWRYPDEGNMHRSSLPPLDLNNLFKYAVPKVSSDIIVNWAKMFTKDREFDPAIALYKTIQEARHGH